MDTTKNAGEKFAQALNKSIMQKQVSYLKGCQDRLGYGPTEMAKMLGTNFNTYKAWLYGQHPMPGIAHIALDCIMRNLPSK